MSTSYEATGRVRQKARTRALLVDAARALLDEGGVPTVEQVADRASISRTTAYRYFPNQRVLLAAAYPDMSAASLLPDGAPDDALERLALVTDRIARQLVEHEQILRAQLRLSLDPETLGGDELVFRRGRAIGWLQEALAPLEPRIGSGELRRLVLAIRATMGIEALVWLTDVGRLSPMDAVAIMRDSAQTLARAKVEESRR